MNVSTVATARLDATTASGDTHQYRFFGARQLSEFSDWYRQYHGYLAVIVCVFGIIANVLNIIVLTRRNMITATNCISDGTRRLRRTDHGCVFAVCHAFLRVVWQ
jgi:hypothetical protein